jgi:hypothetical protein
MTLAEQTQAAYRRRLKALPEYGADIYNGKLSMN